MLGPRGGSPAPATERGFFSPVGLPRAATERRERWLIPVDGSDDCLRAVDRVVGLCRGGPVRDLHLLHVQEPMSDWQVRKYYSEARCRQWLQGRSEYALQGPRFALDRAGLAYGCHAEAGAVADTIVRVARELDCGLIVLGTSGVSVSRALFGRAIGFRVAAQSSIPVLLVPADAH